ncbi:uncharacterized protein H6S33_010291 [Morchella sextelata]|uniref:uncharacterized protein n=1 Tax=Morchella sextelata TaxID=1174677 RepID=UPI001D04BF30|nr:uncharacterized protein H6S33_010291 [Morchella sextelata]KAH0612239.1 hypothetical protein H6S33_010291 [Morchella sextelata]
MMTEEEGSFARDLPDSSAASGDSVTRVSSGRTILLLLGAPRASTLRNLPLIDFDNDDNNKEDLPAFWGQTSGNVDHVTSTSLPIPSATEHPAVWRILPLKRKYLHTGFSQRPEVHTPAYLRREELRQDYNSSIDPSSTTSTDIGDDDLNRSFAVHNMPSSPVAGPSDLEASFTSTAAASSFSSITETPAPPPMLSIIPSMALTNLQNLPTASYLKSIVPQTMSISAIVGIIQISEPRTFTMKRYGTQLTIQTLLVGDETSAGFKLDLWLPNGKLTSAGEAFVATVDSLRVGDIILVQNMALGFWDNRVNGATLRKDRTRIELIYRVNYSGSRERQQWRAVDLERVSEDRSGVEKVKRVLEYVRNFVGSARPTKKIKKKSREVYEEEEDT